MTLTSVIAAIAALKAADSRAKTFDRDPASSVLRDLALAEKTLVTDEILKIDAERIDYYVQNNAGTLRKVAAAIERGDPADVRALRRIASFLDGQPATMKVEEV